MRKLLHVCVCLSILLSLLPPLATARAATPTPTEPAATSTPQGATPTPTSSPTTAPIGAAPSATAMTSAASPTATETAPPGATSTDTTTATATSAATQTATSSSTATATASPTSVVTATTIITGSTDITATVDVDPETGGVMRSANKRVTVTFSPGAIKRQAKATIKSLDPSPYPNQGWRTFEVVDLKARYVDDDSEVVSFDQPVTLTITYGHIPGYTLMQDSLTILYWNAVTSKWEVIPTKVDKDGQDHNGRPNSL